MADTAIEWATKVWNPTRGCSVVSPGCVNCYAMKQGHRFSGPGRQYFGLTKQTKAGPQWTGRVDTVPGKLTEPLKWRKPERVFVNSMSDLFHEDVPDAFVDQVFAVMALATQHTFIVLTKRPARMRRYCTDPVTPLRLSKILADRAGRNGFAVPWPLPNVVLGVSVEDQQRADARIPLLLQTPAAVRAVSLEPLLGPVDLTDVANPGGFAEGQRHLHVLKQYAWECSGPDYVDTCNIGVGLDWLIVGGESGPGARPCDVAWIRSIVQQGQAAGAATFVKQLGAHCVDAFGGYTEAAGGEWPVGTRAHVGATMDAPRRIQFNHRKGGDPSEWPADLRVREFPKGGAA